MMSKKTNKSHNYFLEAQNCQNPERSIDLLDRALSLDPSNLYAYVLRAISLAEQNRFSEALSDLEKAHKLASGSLKASFTAMLIRFYQGKYDEALDAATITITKALDNPSLTTSNLSKFKKGFKEADYLKLTTDELALCYLFRAKSLTERDDYTQSLKDVEKATELDTTKKIKAIISSFKFKLTKTLSIQAEKAQESKLSYRVLNSFFSMPEVCFWVLNLILFGYSIKCYSDARPIAAFNLFVLGMLIFPPLITTISWLIAKAFSLNIIKFERMLYIFFFVIFSTFTWSIIFQNFGNSNFADSGEDSVSSPHISITVGMDSDIAVEKMFDFAQANGGDVNCQRDTPMICEYTSPGRDRTLVYFEHEFTYFAMNPRKTKVIRVEYR